MRFTTTTVAAFLLSVGVASGFTVQPAFVASSVAAPQGLFMSEAPTEEVPPEVDAMDGIESSEEAHNADRPARASIAKKKPAAGKPISELEIGSMVTGRVKTITNYGAFMDIGAASDGLLHISNLSAEFVANVGDVIEAGKEYQVRIITIDEAKNQVALSLLTAEEEEASKNARPPQRQQQNQSRGGGRRDDSAVAAALNEKGFDSGKFVEGTVASTVDFGAFVRFDASQLNSEVEGEMDGLVHISALTPGRADSVTAICNTGDKVQIRCKSIEGRKVSLSMISVEDEKAANERRRSGGGGPPVFEGAKDWKESLEKISETLPEFSNGPLVVDMRK
ncbi:30S Ribosomal protein S1 [Seminavis robusta]|uniref:30S Ribosomal protein S1 n=1 Tax=Seminavis robusta TaxID=568900 RepID=A0A9N8DWT4_9STRA|nr:30S Ribosomal protein S1 [Seminavis robusta]|eukprot:Sro411_g137640.1 30S Ribosomal protein S1 (336) ;mRNA; r:31445-32591